MPAKIISTGNAEHYTWGEGCDAWYLVKQDGLHVIEEAMPPGTSEKRHHHVRARQFAYVLQGVLTFDIEHHVYHLHVGEGIEIAPGQRHQARNEGTEKVRFLLTSVPPSHGDRVDD